MLWINNYKFPETANLSLSTKYQPYAKYKARKKYEKRNRRTSNYKFLNSRYRLLSIHNAPLAATFLNLSVNIEISEFMLPTLKYLWNEIFCPLFYSRKLKSMLYWFIIFKFKLCSGAQNDFSIPPKLAKNAIFVFRGLELVTS